MSLSDRQSDFYPGGSAMTMGHVSPTCKSTTLLGHVVPIRSSAMVLASVGR